MSDFNAYIPMDRRQALARQETLPERAEGTALFTDISGFTSLTAVLAEELGPQRGAEKLTQYLNRIYGVLIDVVHQYRGSVISFSGDGITCWFDKDDTMRGVAAAYKMQQAILNLEAIGTPSGKQIRMDIKTAVASGRVNRFLVGDSRINQLDVLAGGLLDTLAHIERVLAPGEIGIDESVVPVVEENHRKIIWQKTREGNTFCLLPVPGVLPDEESWSVHAPISIEILKPWLLPSVWEQLERGQAEFLAELRPVVALFINFRGINYDQDSEAKEKLDLFVQYVQQILIPYEGQLLELTIGDKGSYMYVAFGSFRAHTDDCDRAIHAAQEVLRGTEKFAYIQDLKMGISRGRMRTGAYGSSSRRVYGVQGLDVNLAARLMAEAEPGQILVSKQLVEASFSDQYIFQELGDLQLRGFSQPITTYLVLDQKVQTSRQTAVSGEVIGRQSERNLFRQYLAALRSRESRLLLIEGEAGIGKSYLVADFISTAQSRNVVYLYGAGDPIGQATPYHAWREVIHRLLGVPMDVGTFDEPRKKIWREQVLGRLQHLDSELMSLAPLLNTFIPLDFPEDKWTAQMGEIVRADNIHDLVIRLLQETAVSAPLLLVLEDAHWMDSASVALLRMVQRSVLPLLIVVTTRPQSAPLPVEHTRLREHPDTNFVTLHPLSKEHIDTLICKRLNIIQLPQPVAKLIHDKAEGHPFFSEELAYALRDAHIIEVDEETCHLTTDVEELKNLAFPDTIQGVIINRLDQLSPQQQITLKVASVIGRIFAFQILQDVYPDEAGRISLKKNLLELEQLKITQQEAPEPHLAYIFKHIITQEVTYNLMTFSQRQELHQRIAEVYEAYFAQDLSSVYELLAYHWSRAENVQRAIEYLEKAGEQAGRNAADEEAIYFFTKALTLDEEAGFVCDAKRRARWHLLTGQSYVNWSRYDEGQKHLKMGLTLLEKAKFSNSLISQLGQVIGQLIKQGYYKRRPPDYEKKSDTERTMLLAASRAYSRFVEIDYHLGNLIGSIFDSFYALNLAEEAGPSAELAEAAAPVGIFWSIIPWRSQAEFYLSRAIQTAEKAKDIEALSYALMVQGTYQTGIGQWAEAQTQYNRLIELNKQFASRRLNDGYHHLSRVYYLQGRFEDSMKTAVSLMASAQKLNDQRFEAYGLQCQAYNFLYCGQLKEALNNLETLFELFNREEGINDEQMELDTYGLLALVHLKLESFENAFKFAVRSQELASPFPSGYYNLPGYVHPVEVYLKLQAHGYGDTSLQKRIKQASKLLNSYARVFTIGKPRTHLLRGVHALQQGKEVKAQKIWQKGLEIAESLSMPYEQGRLHFQLGEHAQEKADRDFHSQRAIAIFEELGLAIENLRLGRM